MKKSVFYVVFIVLAGCGNISSLNERMDKSTEMIQGNTAAIQKSSEVISNNTLAVMESSKNLEKSTEVIAGSAALLQQTMNQLNLHPVLFPFILLLILLALSLPSVILYHSYRTLSQKITALLENGKKRQ
ncbi:MAG: hypothetical protein K2P51_05280 [Rhabdochlamydiaceae bacterium]|nr:hypothetical protein [Rhabdochlamydiaceae bacterium]